MQYNQYRPSGFRVLPPVVKNLIIINGLIFLGTYALRHALEIDLFDYLGLHYVLSDKFNPFQFVTYMFLHGGMAHIFFNMFALWMFGNVLENVWGPKRFLTYYIITGIGAALIQMLVYWWEFHSVFQQVEVYAKSPSYDAFYLFAKNYIGYIPDSLEGQEFINAMNVLLNNWQTALSDSQRYTYATESIQYLDQLIRYRMDIVTVGASGAVFGILLAFGMMFPNALLYVFFAIPVKAKYFVMIYGALELYLGISNNPGDNVAHFAHLGGMIFGFFLIKYWNKRIRFHS
jgi:membrane associated rhomboid family serine protease